MSFKIKQRVIGHYQGALGGSHWFPGRVSKVYQNGLVDIAYDDGDEEYKIGPPFVKAWDGIGTIHPIRGNINADASSSSSAFTSSASSSSSANNSTNNSRSHSRLGNLVQSSSTTASVPIASASSTAARNFTRVWNKRTFKWEDVAHSDAADSTQNAPSASAVSFGNYKAPPSTTSTTSTTSSTTTSSRPVSEPLPTTRFQTGASVLSKHPSLGWVKTTVIQTYLDTGKLPGTLATLTKTLPTCKRGHTLQPLGTTTKTEWYCDGRNEPGGCVQPHATHATPPQMVSMVKRHSSQKNVLQKKVLHTNDVARFRCSQCDYDLCNKCHEKEAKGTKNCYIMQINSGPHVSTQFQIQKDTEQFVRKIPRFPVGAKIFIKNENGWQKGEVTCAPYHPRNWTHDYALIMSHDDSVKYITKDTGNGLLRYGQWGSMKMPDTFEDVKKIADDYDNDEDEDAQDSECPEWMKCSISLKRLVDPVIASDGHTYSRTEIQHWFDSGRKTSPKTNAPLPNLQLLQNWLAKSQIDKWCEEKTSTIMLSTKLTTLFGQVMNSTSENETNICVSAMEKLVDLATSQGKIIMSEFNIKQLETHIVASQVNGTEAIRLLALRQKCSESIVRVQEMHRDFLNKCKDLDTAKSAQVDAEDEFDENIDEAESNLSTLNIEKVEI